LEEYKKHQQLRDISNKVSFNIHLLLLKKNISQLVSPACNTFLFWWLGINRNCRKAHNLLLSLHFVIYSWLLNIITLRE